MRNLSKWNIQIIKYPKWYLFIYYLRFYIHTYQQLTVSYTYIVQERKINSQAQYSGHAFPGQWLHV